MVFWNLEAGLEIKRGFDERCHKAGRYVPLYVAVEEPDPRVVGAEAEDGVAVWSHHDGISLHRDPGKGFVADVDAGAFVGAYDGLEGVPV